MDALSRVFNRLCLCLCLSRVNLIYIPYWFTNIIQKYIKNTRKNTIIFI